MNRTTSDRQRLNAQTLRSVRPRGWICGQSACHLFIQLLFLRIFYISAKSPVFSHISATLGGLSTIRAFQAQDLLRKEFEDHQDLNTGTYFMYIGTISTEV